jgi:LysM repeat protein
VWKKSLTFISLALKSILTTESQGSKIRKYYKNISTSIKNVFSLYRRVKANISCSVKENKGFIKSSFLSLKISLFLFFSLLLVIGFLNSSGDGKIASITLNNDLNTDNNLFLRSAETPDEPSSLLISQDNTIYASTPSYHPRVQLLGSGHISLDKENKEIISYKVQSGDNLSAIASKFEVSRNTIVWANELRNTNIKIGQELIILPVSGVFHIAGTNDTISGIAKRYNAKVDDILSFNSLDKTSIISLGDIIIVPGGEMPKFIKSSATISSSGFIAPASGVVTQGYHSSHRAIDIANVCGSPIYASASGTVQATGYTSIGGNYIRITHSNGAVAYYGHLSRILVSRGQRVSQGSIIGYMGNTGYTIGVTGCHIHFETRGMTNPFINYRVGSRF